MSVLDRAGIEALLPHREPFLFLDRVTELEPGVRAIGEKDVTEAMCAGHFPGHPVMPGVLITEAMAQLCAIVALSAMPDRQGKPVYLVGADKLRFRSPVHPGDVLTLDVTFEGERRRIHTYRCTARVGDTRAATASLIATVPAD